MVLRKPEYEAEGLVLSKPVITAGEMKVADSNVYLPKQNIRAGIAGYKDPHGIIILVDPKTGKPTDNPGSDTGTRKGRAAYKAKARSTTSKGKNYEKKKVAEEA